MEINDKRLVNCYENGAVCTRQAAPVIHELTTNLKNFYKKSVCVRENLPLASILVGHGIFPVGPHGDAVVVAVVAIVLAQLTHVVGGDGFVGNGPEEVVLVDLYS